LSVTYLTTRVVMRCQSLGREEPKREEGRA
jgi:hypothetical protein